MTLLALKNVTKSYGVTAALDNISLEGIAALFQEADFSAAWVADENEIAEMEGK